MTVRRAFTLIEVMIAVTLGSLTLLLATRITATITNATSEVERDARDHESHMLQLRALRSVLASIDAPRDSTMFRGMPTEMSFTTSIRDSVEGYERKSITLRAEQGALVAIDAHGRVTSLIGADSVAFEYLASRGANARFLREWASSAEFPVAVRVTLQRCSQRAGCVADTLLMATGDTQ